MLGLTSCLIHNGSARLGSTYGWWCGRWVPLADVSDDWSMMWLLTWTLACHDDCTCWHLHYIMLMSLWAMLLYMMMSQLHHANVIPHMSSVHDDVTFTSCWRHPGYAYCAYWSHYYIMLTSSLSGSAKWVESTGIRVGSVHSGEEDAWHAWGASARLGRHFVGACGRVWPCSTSDFDVVFTSGFVSSSSTQ